MLCVGLFQDRGNYKMENQALLKHHTDARPSTREIFLRLKGWSDSKEEEGEEEEEVEDDRTEKKNSSL